MKTLRFADRDIVKYKGQGFYRSTGHNSKMPGKWLPFDGIMNIGFCRNWFDKTEYCIPKVQADLNRFGTVILMKWSSELEVMALPPGKFATPRQINRFLGRSKADYYDFAPSAYRRWCKEWRQKYG